MLKKISSLVCLSALILLSVPAQAEYCVIVGSHSYEAFDGAQRVATKVRKVGFPDVAIYDTRDFQDLTYGQLAVVALMTEDKGAARAAKKRLTRKKIKVYVRGCTPAIDPVALQSKADIEPNPEMPANAMALDLTKALSSGCHGWSPSHGLAFCVVGNDSWQDASDLTVVLPPSDIQIPIASNEVGPLSDEDHILSKKLRTKLAKLIKRYGFVALPESTEHRNFATPRVRIKHGRKRVGAEASESGSWDVFEEHVTVTCGGAEQVVASTQEGNLEGDLKAWYLVYNAKPSTTSQPAVLIEYGWSFALEGDYGGGTRAALYTQADCGPVRTKASQDKPQAPAKP